MLSVRVSGIVGVTVSSQKLESHIYRIYVYLILEFLFIFRIKFDIWIAFFFLESLSSFILEADSFTIKIRF